MKVVRSFSRQPPRGTIVTESIIYGTPTSKHSECDSVDRVDFEVNERAFEVNERAMVICIALRIDVFST